MGTVKVQLYTTRTPIAMMGREAGYCYGSDIDNYNKCYKRGLECIKTNHGRVMEYPQIYLEIEGYSAKVIRELYTHIGGMPTRLQASTRYIEYGKFYFVTPPSIANNPTALKLYNVEMDNISNTIQCLEELGVPREDASMLLPLGMETKIVLRTNLRNLVDMSKQRMCSRAFWEYRVLMKDILKALSNYTLDWNYLIKELNLFHPKCDDFEYCTEKNCCGRTKKKD